MKAVIEKRTEDRHARCGMLMVVINMADFQRTRRQVATYPGSLVVCILRGPRSASSKAPRLMAGGV